MRCGDVQQTNSPSKLQLDECHEENSSEACAKNDIPSKMEFRC